MDIATIQTQLSELKKQEESLKSRIRKGEKMLKEAQRKSDLEKYNPVIEESVYCRSDYAGFTAGEYTFYYGYEEEDYHPFLVEYEDKSQQKTWAFVVFKDGIELYRKAILPEHVEWNNLAGLLSGIGYWLKDKEQINKSKVTVV